MGRAESRGRARVRPVAIQSSCLLIAAAGHRIRVTLWPDHRPPRVSCFTVHCPDLPASAFGDLPVILYTEDDLALLRVAICRRRHMHMYARSKDHFVYHAGGSEREKKPPSLHLIPMPSGDFGFCDHDPVLLSRRRGVFIAVLHRAAASASDDDRGQQYDLHLYSSEAGAWSTIPTRAPRDSTYVYSSKAITIGGERGSVAWADLWRGILICNVLSGDDRSNLRYIPLPPPAVPKEAKGPPLVIRDIVVAGGCIRYFDMDTYGKPGSRTEYSYTPDGWEAATWKLNLSEKDPRWEEDCRIKISEVSVDPAYAQKLPSLRENEGVGPLMRLHVAYPALSLHDDGVVHIMNKVERHEDRAWVVSVDMRRKIVEGVDYFCTGRPVGYSFTYLESGISKHLKYLNG